MTQESFDTEALLRLTVEKLKELLESIELHGDGEHGSTVQDIARVSVAITTACAELRQHSKAQRRQLASYSLDQIVDHLKTLSERQRKDVARELTGADDQEPLL